MKIAIDENIPFANETFGLHGEIVRYPGRSLTAKDVPGIDALITRSVTKVNAELFAQVKPQFVGTCTIGTDHLDKAYLESESIPWVHAPGCNAQSVVDYVLAAVAALNSDELPKNVGIVGCGNVGGLLSKRMRALGLTLRVYDPFLSVDQVPELTSLDAVFQSELVCLHTPFTSSGEFPTAAMVGRQQLEQLPENAMLVSAGRGGVIVESELKQFMQERGDVRVALDVWHGEPCIDEELLERVDIATPHVAGYSLEGKRNGTLQVYQAFCRHFDVAPATPPLLERRALGVADRVVCPENIDHQWAEYLLAAYNPLKDAQRMRQAFLAADTERRAQGFWFDQLRRDYPERRELASFDVPDVLGLSGSSDLSSSMDLQQKALLKKLGFLI